MIDYGTLRQLVLEVLKTQRKTQLSTLENSVLEYAAASNAFPSEERCRELDSDYSYYRNGQLNPMDVANINQIVWDLVVERVLTIGRGDTDKNWPFLRLTDHGRALVNQQEPTYHDPEGYLRRLRGVVPGPGPVIEQYALEGLHCFRGNLLFAAAVMFGAAAETAVLALLEAIAHAESDPRRKKKAEELLERPKLPTIFELIQKTVDGLAQSGVLPYEVHEGSTPHLISLFEMIRAHRNDAVHPRVGDVNGTKVFLTIQSFPGALEATFRLVEWFRNNTI